MPFNFHFSWLDWMLVAVVSLQSTAMAYVYRPKWKALLSILPCAFTVAALSLGQPIDSTNVTALLLYGAFVFGLWFLFRQCRVPIIVTIALMIIVFCIAALGLARVLPKTNQAFWIMTGIVVLVAGILHWTIPHIEEEGDRSSLPIWVKLPIIVGVVVLILVLKQQLQGFMTVFPMVGVISAYESRHCLWATCRQFSVMAFAVLMMFIAIRLLQPYIGFQWALIPGWMVYLGVLIPMLRRQWKVKPGLDVKELSAMGG